MIRIRLTSVMVDDQQKARDFYTRKLGFAVKRDIPMGEQNQRWPVQASSIGETDPAEKRLAADREGPELEHRGARQEKPLHWLHGSNHRS